MNSNKFKRGFTLMEVLVSTAIFAVVMAIATGVIAQGSSYSTKIKKMRETSEDARRLADMLTRDIKSVKSPITVQYTTGTVGKIDDVVPSSSKGVLKSGILILNSVNLSIYNDSSFALNGLASPQYDASSVILAGSEYYMVYIKGTNCPYNSITIPNCVYYSNSIPVSTVLTKTILNDLKLDSNNIISNTNYKALIGFGGYAPWIDSATSSETQKMQSIVNFVITVSVNDFNKPFYKGESATIRSSVTSRNYGI